MIRLLIATCLAITFSAGHAYAGEKTVKSMGEAMLELLKESK
jgi:hypothetical protein